MQIPLANILRIPSRTDSTVFLKIFFANCFKYYFENVFGNSFKFVTFMPLENSSKKSCVIFYGFFFCSLARAPGGVAGGSRRKNPEEVREELLNSWKYSWMHSSERKIFRFFRKEFSEGFYANFRNDSSKIFWKILTSIFDINYEGAFKKRKQDPRRNCRKNSSRKLPREFFWKLPEEFPEDLEQKFSKGLAKEFPRILPEWISGRSSG